MNASHRTRLGIGALALAAAIPAQAQPAAKPGVDCARARPDSVDTLICSTPLLGALDAEMARLLRLATRNETLRKMQAGWLQRRDACHARPDEPVCVRDAYLARIDGLRALGKPVRSADGQGISLGPVAYRCGGLDGFVKATFVHTDPAFARLRHQGSVWVMEQQRSASGARYGSSAGGEGALFWSKGRGAMFRSGAGQPETSCQEVALD